MWLAHTLFIVRDVITWNPDSCLLVKKTMQNAIVKLRQDEKSESLHKHWPMQHLEWRKKKKETTGGLSRQASRPRKAGAADDRNNGALQRNSLKQLWVTSATTFGVWRKICSHIQACLWNLEEAMPWPGLHRAASGTDSFMFTHDGRQNGSSNAGEEIYRNMSDCKF